MKIVLSSVLVDDQDRALHFYSYSDVLGFIEKQNFPVGEFRWLTVVSPDAPDGTQLVLEPNDNPAARTYQKALFDQGIPSAAFAVDDIQAEYDRLKGLGVAFRSELANEGPGPAMAMFEDTCGNLVQIFQA